MAAGYEALLEQGFSLETDCKLMGFTRPDRCSSRSLIPLCLLPAECWEAKLYMRLVILSALPLNGMLAPSAYFV